MVTKVQLLWQGKKKTRAQFSEMLCMGKISILHDMGFKELLIRWESAWVRN
jgi:hypothetical protein